MPELVARARSMSLLVGSLAAIACSASSNGGVTSPNDAVPDTSIADAAADGGPDGDDAAAETDDASTDGDGRVATCGDGGADAIDAGGVRVRVVAANLTSGTSQKYEAPGVHILQGLKPDVVMIQEFDDATTQRALVDEAFGAGFSFVAGTGTIPNGVVSRYPIVEHGEWADARVANRDFVWARIDVPGPVDLWAVSVHLLTTDAGSRNAEAQEIVDAVKAKGIPSTDYMVVGGDFNTATRAESALATLAPIVVIPNGGYPADQNGNDLTNQPRSKPHDWVLANGSLSAHETPVVIGASRYPHGLVFDSRVYTPLTEVAPATAADSAASGMQHMAIVRDFALGCP